MTLTCVQTRADSMASIAITPATGAVTLVPQWAIGGSLAGFHFMAQDLSLGGGASQFYSIKGTPIPAGGDITAFAHYIAASGAATNHADIGSKLTPDSYSALTSADPDIGYGAVNFYLIHHKTTGDYFTVIVPSSGTASAVTDLKPMDGPGGPGTLGTSGYFGLTFAAANLGYGLNMFYYLRTDPVTGNTKFGTLDPALLGTSADKFDLGMGGFNALEFTGTDVGFGTDKMYYLRLDPVTGFTILGMLDPVTGRVSDVANLGSIYSTLTFVPGDVGFGSNHFYTTGAVNTTWQSVSFAAIADRAISAGSFAVTPSASSGLPITLKVVSGSTGAASISGPVAGVFTVTPTAPGVITLQATQTGQLAPTAYEYNMLRQSFTATGTTLLGITTQPTSQTAVIGTNSTISVVATGTSTVTYQWRKGGANIAGNASATTATLTLANVQSTDAGSYDVVVSNTSGSVLSDTILLTVVNAAPIVTNSPLTAAGTVGSAFTFTITASGTPTSYTASPLPAGLVLNATTGAITGTPTTVGTTSVLLGATNATGTGNATLTVSVAAAGVAPIIANSPLTAAGTVGTPFSFTITASGTPTGYTATPLPAGLSVNATTGAITGTPTAVGTTSVLLGATNATGTGNATLTVTVAAAGVAPIITNSPLTAAGTVGTPFSFAITASGTPASYTATPLPAGLTLNATTGTITGTPTTVGTTAVLLGATNATGTGNATLTVTVAAAGVAPIITNSPLTAAGTVGIPFSFTITASGTPTAYTASPLPAGLTLNATTGTITGTPTAVGTASVLLGATNATGTGNATLVVTVAAAGVAPIIANSPLTAAGTVGTPFSFTIAASGTPTAYSATPLPAGLVLNATTGAITGTPTATGTTSVLLGATNATGTGNATLTVTVAAAGVAPIVTNSPLTAAGTVGTAFSFTITASGTPTAYSASPLPEGLVVNATTGVITGTPTAVGTTAVLLGATNPTGTGNATLVVTVAAAGVAPIITNSPLTAAGTVGTAFSYTITASGSPTSYSATPLPAGLTINTVTGTITGTPTAAGTTSVLVGADNATGTGIATVTITVATAGTPPVIANDPLTVGGSVGTPFGFTITASGTPTSYSANPLPAGLVFNSATGTISGIPSAIGITQVDLGATNAAGTGNAMVTITIGAAGIAPIITNYPLAVTGTIGKPFSFTITASGAPLSFQASPLPSGLVINTTTGVITGIPTAVAESAVLVSASNAAGTGHAILMIKVVPVPRSWISVFSARAMCGPGDKVLIVGFYESGGSENVLVRAIGPGMIPYGVPNAIVDPKLTIFGGSSEQATNDNWEMGSNGQPDGAAIAAAAAKVGAFSLASGSKDASLLFSAQEGVPTTCLIEPNTTPGDTLAELYDTDNGLGGQITSVSARMQVAGAGFTSTVGLVIAGDAPKTLLVRGVGPTLATFGVSGVIADPVITLFSGNVVTQIATNDNWEVGDTTAAQLRQVAAQTGAFPLPAGSKDAALLVTLQPGTYTVQVTGVNGATGVVLLEFYVVD